MVIHYTGAGTWTICSLMTSRLHIVECTISAIVSFIITRWRSLMTVMSFSSARRKYLLTQLILIFPWYWYLLVFPTNWHSRIGDYIVQLILTDADGLWSGPCSAQTSGKPAADHSESRVAAEFGNPATGANSHPAVLQTESAQPRAPRSPFAHPQINIGMQLPYPILHVCYIIRERKTNKN